MKWRSEPDHVVRNRNRAMLKEWHTWFAWHPVTAFDDEYDTRVWLENVERRVLYWYGEDHHIPVYEYRSKE